MLNVKTTSDSLWPVPLEIGQADSGFFDNASVTLLAQVRTDTCAHRVSCTAGATSQQATDTANLTGSATEAKAWMSDARGVGGYRHHRPARRFRQPPESQRAPLETPPSGTKSPRPGAARMRSSAAKDSSGRYTLVDDSLVETLANSSGQDSLIIYSMTLVRSLAAATLILTSLRPPLSPPQIHHLLQVPTD